MFFLVFMCYLIVFGPVNYTLSVIPDDTLLGKLRVDIRLKYMTMFTIENSSLIALKKFIFSLMHQISFFWKRAGHEVVCFIVMHKHNF